VPKLSGNGTSGVAVIQDALEPLGIAPRAVAFSDIVNRFFVKRSQPRDQGMLHDDIYTPFLQSLAEAGAFQPPVVMLPARPSPAALVALATAEHAERLVCEIDTSGAPVLLTLGEEARQVLAAIASSSSGPPTNQLRASAPDYGHPGTVTIGNTERQWRALVHPGQRSEPWRDARSRWKTSLQ
jgi:hypothetical protein